MNPGMWFCNLYNMRYSKLCGIRFDKYPNKFLDMFLHRNSCIPLGSFPLL